MNAQPVFSRAALALIALLGGGMGFVEATAAVPAQSTALAADGLLFLRESVLAWLGMWMMVGAFGRGALVARIVGLVMMALGAGVLAIAIGRLTVGSTPEPMTMIGFGTIALAVQLTTGTLALRYRQVPVSLAAVLRASWDGCFAHLLLIGAGVAFLVAKTNIGDIAVGGAIAALYAVSGLVTLVRGRLAGPSAG